MSEENKQREEPIIIKKKKGHGGHGAHGGAWKVAYADFVTAMMAFFIVMWILGQSEDVKKSVTQYFEDPGAFNFLNGKKTIPVDLNLKPEKTKDGGDIKESKNGKNNFFFVVPPKDSNRAPNSKELMQAMKDSVQAADRVKKMADEIKKFIDKELITNPQMKEILTSIKIEMTKEGLRIELIESKESVFFEIGSAKVKPEAKNLLIKLSKEIGKLPNFVDVEGHTDSRQYTSKNGYTNWDLSADRANSARRLLDGNGLWEGQVSKVIGYADRKLQNPDNPFDVSNRRISILIKQLSADDFISGQKR